MYEHILLPVDLDEKKQLSLPVAVDYAKAFGAQLHVMTVVPEFGMSIISQYFPGNSDDKMIQAAQVALKDFTKKHIPEGIKVQHIVGQGTVYQVIIETSEKINADLIIMGAHRPDLKDYLLGPNAARVVRHSDKSVLVVRDK
ncbi:MAG: universal stress protein UspA [Rickettsiales bacterium]|nr:universal stress protein UspA [Rickettsiales bacterium]|tara:strand:- start:528 stop:953 length:426 start_codon:yes stop_codon:yes gene_type:complete